MGANWWLWIALIAFLIFCFLPMLFMRKRNSRSHDTPKGEDSNARLKSDNDSR
jgi:cytochrome c-type biogenesis protein CcmH/NrfF